jgi:PST family polysaccharide transporter
MLGETATGLYTRAFNLTRLPQLRVVNLVYQVSYPAFCRLRDDEPRFHDMFERAARLIALTVAPILLGLAALSDDFILGVLGPQWSAMTLPLSLLAGAALVNSLHTLVGAAIEASGRVSIEVFTQGTYALMIVVGTVVGARSGIEGVSYAVLVSALLFFALKAATIHLALGMPMRRFIRPILGPLVAAGVMFAVVRVFLAVGSTEFTPLAPSHHLTRLFAGAAAGALTYISLLPLVASEHVKLLRQQIAKLRTELRPATTSSHVGTG